MARAASFVGTLIHLVVLVMLVEPTGMQAQLSPAVGPQPTAKYVGSRACQPCHSDIYAH